MDYSYYLLSASGMDVIIIPELDCRINIFDPLREGIDPVYGTHVIYAEILHKKLAFQAVGPNCPDEQELAKAAAWYGERKLRQ